MKRIINMDDSISPPFHGKKTKNFEIQAASKESTVKYNSKELEGIPIELSINAKINKEVRIPELRGLSMRKAMNTLSNQGIVPDMIGSGKVAWQSPSPGTLVQSGDICKIGLK